MYVSKVEKRPCNFKGCHQPLSGIYGELPLTYQPYTPSLYRIIPRRYATIIEPN